MTNEKGTQNPNHNLSDVKYSVCFIHLTCSVLCGNVVMWYSVVQSTQNGHLYTRGGGLGYFLGWYVPPGTPNWHPVLEMGQFFIPRSRIRPKTDTPF